MHKLKYVHGTFKVSQFCFQTNQCNILLLISHAKCCIHAYHNAPVKQWRDSQPHHLQNQKNIPKSCTRSLWHVSDRLLCWPMLSQCLMNL